MRLSSRFFAAGRCYDRAVQIALDATPLTEPTGGLRRYTVELCRALAEAREEDTIWLLTDQAVEHPMPELANVRMGEQPGNALHRRWWAWGLNRELRRRAVDVFHGTDFSVPYLPARPSVMSLHDLSPWKDPAWHTGAARVRRRTPVLVRAGLATMIITLTEAVRREVIERFQVAADRVCAVPLAAAKTLRSERIKAEGTPFFLYAGTLEPRKNLGRAIAAWREVRKSHEVDLVLAGRRREDFEEPAAEPGLRLAGAVTEEELRALYARAAACVYPSFYEGFGLPVLEAMQCGAPVLIATEPSLLEVAGDAALAQDAGSTENWARAMTAVLTKPELAADLSARGLGRAAQFSWQKTAAGTREVYAEAIQRYRHRTVPFA